MFLFGCSEVHRTCTLGASCCGGRLSGRSLLFIYYNFYFQPPSNPNFALPPLQLFFLQTGIPKIIKRHSLHPKHSSQNGAIFPLNENLGEIFLGNVLNYTTNKAFNRCAPLSRLYTFGTFHPRYRRY